MSSSNTESIRSPGGSGRLPKLSEATSKLRLATGLVLLFFTATHLIGHALGNISMAWMNWGQEIREAVWQSAPGTILLYGALVIHIVLAIAKTVSRRTFRLPASEWIQLLLGLAIPYFLIEHLYFTRGTEELFDVHVDYEHYLSIAWPWAFGKQTLLMTIVWTHAMVGLHLWWRYRPWYLLWRPTFIAFAVAVPLLSTTGWATAGKELVLTDVETIRFTWEQEQQLVLWASRAQVIAFVGFVLTLLYPLGSLAIRRFKSSMVISYVGDKQVRAAPGPTLLEISRANNVAHTAICGGRARCSTCRVRIVSGSDQLPPASDRELAVLANIKAGDDVRLACQIRPKHDLSVIRLVRPREQQNAVQTSDAYRWGVEQPVIVMFTDLRGFTRFSEKRLPYDIVFVLNAYLESSARRIVEHHGVVDKFMGDGIMALFGVGRSFEDAARDALTAAVALQEGIEALNNDLKQHIGEPLKLVIAIHGGPAILGRIGHSGGDGPLTALGDTVNTASRLEGIVKLKDARIVASQDIVRGAGLAIDQIGERDEVTVRGREGAAEIAIVYDHTRLLAALENRSVEA